MRGAKRIIDKEMLVLGKFLNKFWIIGFTRPEAEIFQKGDWGSGGPHCSISSSVLSMGILSLVKSISVFRTGLRL